MLPSAVDAIVAASAAVRGDVVLTSDVGDSTALASQLTGVDVLAIDLLGRRALYGSERPSWDAFRPATGAP